MIYINNLQIINEEIGNHYFLCSDREDFKNRILMIFPKDKNSKYTVIDQLILHMFTTKNVENKKKYKPLIDELFLHGLKISFNGVIYDCIDEYHINIDKQIERRRIPLDKNTRVVNIIH